MELFDIPEFNPINLARALERDGEETRRRMRKGPEYMTNEKKAAQLIRWYVRTNGSSTVARNAEMLMHEAVNHAKRQRKLFMTVCVFFAGYVMATVSLFVYMIGG